jgi:probable F420-dependent oxidoreductase
MAIGIGMGTSVFPFDNARDYFKWVDKCEAGKVDSIWQTDRLVSKESMLECLSAMAILAGYTESIRFGMNVASIAIRDPLVTAKQCATIDYISGGRLLPAFGLGSKISRDYTATNISTKGRGKKADEALEIVSRLWTEDSVTFQGEHFSYKDAVITPRPANASIPLWIGGSSQIAVKRTARIGTGWLGGIDSPETAGAVVSGVKEALKNTEREIDDDHYGATLLFRFGNQEDRSVLSTTKGITARMGKNARRYYVVGTTSEIVERIKEFIDVGCQKFVLLPMASGTKEVMEQTRLCIDEIIPEFS